MSEKKNFQRQTSDELLLKTTKKLQGSRVT